MGVLFFVLTCIFILAIISLYLSFSISNKDPFNRVTQFFLIYVIIHVSHAFLVRLAPPEYMYIDRAAPFGLLYGPILYYGHLTAKGYSLNKKTILRHAIPFILALPFYVVFLASSSLRTYSVFYYSSLYGPMALSWLGYSVYVAYKSTVHKEVADSYHREVPSVAVIVLFTLSFYLILSVSTRTFKGMPVTSITSSLMIFTGMLGVVLYVFLIIVNRIKVNINYLESQLVFNKNEEEEEVGLAYIKSGVQTDEIESYAKKINDYLTSKRYLDPKFNLNTLSSDLKIPKHHLSQVFSQYYGQSFLKYINSLRIMHACQLLEDPNLVTNIDDLVEQCGFNSKTSFYRNFREIAKMTPSEFLDRSKKAAG